ncbi:MAG TPA: nickel pincer cofactor biosynthesis protein LarC [Myxococcota bacterium]|nr:nickel pincer cofactor biosynthesis protein LarC [Myxococcota bacterium]
MLHLDAFSGVAGNMLLGALLDLGLPLRALEADLAPLGLRFEIDVRRVRRGALAARYVDVRVPRGRPPRQQAAGAHHHGAPHAHPRRSERAHAHGRSWLEIRRLLARARLVPEVRERALAIFESLAEAEARVHGIAIDAVHFHEVGAVDAIVDITGVAAGLHRLGIRRITCSPLPLGQGSVDTDHGRLPLPAPATLELLRGVPVVPAHLDWETVTPTGAAIVRSVVDEFRVLPAMTVEAIGIGAGDDRHGELPNVLRAVLGRSAGFGADRVAVLETHVDDLNPEHFEYLMERLFEVGALDVALQHLQMKKNRPGFAVRVVARPSEREALARVLFAESTTLGVRVSEADRVVLKREELRVATPFGAIRVKLVRDESGRATPSAEYEDCKRAARRAAVPLREVVRAAEEAARSRTSGAEGRRARRAKSVRQP